jgi:hypothetical protein
MVTRIEVARKKSQEQIYCQVVVSHRYGKIRCHVYQRSESDASVIIGAAYPSLIEFAPSWHVNIPSGLGLL